MDDAATFDSGKLIDLVKYAAGIVDTAASQLGGIGPHTSPHATGVTVLLSSTATAPADTSGGGPAPHRLAL